MPLTKTERRSRIKMRVRKKVFGTQERPRMSVFRSNKQIYVQFIDDEQGRTLACASSESKAAAEGGKVNKTQQAVEVGKLAAEVAKSKGIERVVFDRNGYLYHGRVKALADSARANGLIF